MGYRTYFGLCTHEKRNDLLTYEETEYKGVWELIDGEEKVFEFGSPLTSIHNAIVREATPLFAMTSTQDIYEGDAHAGGVDMLDAAIYAMCEHVSNMETKPEFENINRNTWLLAYEKDHVKRDMSRKWSITSSHMYEHCVFNLMYLRRVIDWERYCLVYYGY